MGKVISYLPKIIENVGTIISHGTMVLISQIKIENIMNQFLLIHLITMIGKEMGMGIPLTLSSLIMDGHIRLQ